MAEENAYTWQGVWNAGADGWNEFFGGADGLPARDLTAADVAGFDKDQMDKLQSETGRRLYTPVSKKGAGGNASKADNDPNL